MSLNSDWDSVEQIDENVFAIAEDAHWEKARCYLFCGEDVSWLIDTGTGIGNIRSLVRSLTSSPIKVLTTHVHWDHMGGHGDFDSIYVHQGDAAWLRDGIPLSLSAIRNDIAKIPFDVPHDSDFVLETYAPPRVESPHIVQHGDVLTNSNFALEVLHTPGHSPGSVCFFERRSGALVTGDVVYRGTIYAHYPSTDPQALYRSYCQLSQLEGIRKILPGHNDSCLSPDILEEGMNLLESIRTAGKLHHGTGEHAGDNIG
ncbi:MBL fold metallo-hydrolase, partial [Candidatus Bipolaricaulota bacterium]|nr:MBL fold metallo-hydrolase [Candidatus Bipolaricaulota bacterium]